MKVKKTMVMLLASLLAMGNFTQTLHAVHEEKYYEEQTDTDRKSFTFQASEKQFVELQAPISKVPDTIEMWVKLDKNTNKRQILFGNYVVNKNCFSLELTQDNQLRYVEYGYEGTTMTSSIDLKTANKAICTEKWTHLAVQRNIKDQSIRLLMDGEIILEKQFDKTGKNKILEVVPLSSNHFIGTDARKSMFLDGEIASIRLWNTYKTVHEIKADMHLDLNGDETGLAHAWILDDTTLSYAHNVVEDIKENGITATTHNFDLSGTTIYQKEGTDFTDGSACAELEGDLALAPLTFEAWVNIPKTSIGERGVMIGNYFDSYYKDIPLVNFELNANGEPRLYWNIDGKTYDYVAKGIHVYTGKWTHIAITYDVITKQMVCYINGEKANEQVIDFMPRVLNQNLRIGRDSRPTMYLKGSMADLRIWSTTRTAEEIKTLYDAEIDENTEGLLGHWNLDKKDDNTFIDASNYANHAVDNWISDDIFAKKEDGYHSIAVIPDTQTLSALRPASFTKLTTWIKDHAESLGIELAIHVGDIVDSNGNQKQWDAAKNSLHVLDGEVPYVFSPGNHDSAFSMVNGVSKRDSSMFNKNFPYAKYAASETFGGAFEIGKMDNTYSFFDIGGVPFMSVSLETSPRDEVLEWANALIEKHADRKVLISTHNYLHLDGTRTTEQTQDHHAFYDNTGDEMWNQMIKNHQNIVLVVSGHIGFPDIVMSEDIGIHGNVVKQILCDAQFVDRENISKFNGDGLGMIMLLSFKEDSDDIQVNWYSTIREEFFRVRNQFTTSMPFTNDNDILLAKEMLRNAMAKVEAISDEDMAKLAPIVQTMLTKAYDEALAIIENNAATQNQCIEAWFQIANALHYANFVADKTELNALIRICDELKEEDYSVGFDTMKTALDNARVVSEDKNALQASIDAAYTSLLNAYKALIKDQDMARETLKEMIAIFDTLDASTYCNNDAWKAFVHAMQDAKVIFEDHHATASQLHTAIFILASTYEDIRLLPDETILKDLSSFLEHLADLDIHAYTTAETIKIMAVAGKARMMLQDPHSYDPVILDELSDVKKLIENKGVLASIEPAIKKPIVLRDIEEHITPIVTNTKGITKTGDTANNVATMMLLFISGASLCLINKKRKPRS